MKTYQKISKLLGAMKNFEKKSNEYQAYREALEQVMRTAPHNQDPFVDAVRNNNGFIVTTILDISGSRPDKLALRIIRYRANVCTSHTMYVIISPLILDFRLKILYDRTCDEFFAHCYSMYTEWLNQDVSEELENGTDTISE